MSQFRRCAGVRSCWSTPTVKPKLSSGRELLLDERSQREADEGSANRLGDGDGSTPDRGATCVGVVRRPPQRPADGADDVTAPNVQQVLDVLAAHLTRSGRSDWGWGRAYRRRVVADVRPEPPLAGATACARRHRPNQSRQGGRTGWARDAIVGGDNAGFHQLKTVEEASDPIRAAQVVGRVGGLVPRAVAGGCGPYLAICR